MVIFSLQVLTVNILHKCQDIIRKRVCLPKQEPKDPAYILPGLFTFLSLAPALFVFTEYFFVSNLTDIIFSRIHSSADEISSVNRSPSELSSSDESFSRTDFSRDEEGESPSPPSRPRSHAPWIYPSDIQIDPSSLEVSPKLPHMSFMPNNNTGNGNSGSEDPLRDLRMPSVGPSPSTFTDDAIR